MADIMSVLVDWAEAHPEFHLGTEAELAAWDWRDSEAEDWRRLDAAVWRVKDLRPYDGPPREPPVLGVAVARHSETEGDLRKEVHRYLLSGVELVWLVLPDMHAVLVADVLVERRYGLDEPLSPHRFVPGLEPRVSDFF